MDLTALSQEQLLRQYLLVRALEAGNTPDQALAKAAYMERFIVEGLRPSAPAQPCAMTAGSVADRPVVTVGSGAKKRRWTAEDEEVLTKRWHEGLALEEIARELGRTFISVRHRALLLGLPKRRRARAQVSGGSDGWNNGYANGRGRFNGKAKRRLPEMTEEEIAARINQHMATHGITRTPMNIETVVNFLRSRDYAVVRNDDKTFKVDDNEVMSAKDLLTKANEVRRRLGKDEFPDSVLTAPEPAKVH